GSCSASQTVCASFARPVVRGREHAADELGGRAVTASVAVIQPDATDNGSRPGAALPSSGSAPSSHHTVLLPGPPPWPDPPTHRQPTTTPVTDRHPIPKTVTQRNCGECLRTSVRAMAGRKIAQAGPLPACSGPRGPG